MKIFSPKPFDFWMWPKIWKKREIFIMLRKLSANYTHLRRYQNYMTFCRLHFKLLNSSWAKKKQFSANVILRIQFKMRPDGNACGITWRFSIEPFSIWWAQQFVNNAQNSSFQNVLEYFVVVFFLLEITLFMEACLTRTSISIAVLPIISQKSKRLILIN